MNQNKRIIIYAKLLTIYVVYVSKANFPQY